MDLSLISDAAREVGVNDQTLRNYVRDTKLTEYKLRGRVAVDMAEVRALFGVARLSTASPDTSGARVLAIANQKGGTGKTTTAAALGYLLARRAPTLLIDADPQGNLTQAFGINPDKLEATLYEVLVHRRPLDQVVQTLPPPPEGLSLIGANLDLGETTMQLAGKASWGGILRRSLQPLLARYRYVVIDCPPSLDALTINALVAATEVIVPVEMGAFSLRGTSKLLDAIRGVREDFNPDLPAPRFLACRTEANNTLSTTIQDDLRSLYAGRLFKTSIRKATVIGKAQYSKQPLFVFAPDSAAARDYECLLKELLDE